MPELHTVITFALVALVMVCTPGPNMIYLVSRSVCQGPRARLVSLAGIAAAFVVYLLSTALGITELLMAVPLTYDALRFAGAAYLLYLAWQAVRPGGRSPFEVKNLSPDSPPKLILMGFGTNMLNPKAAVLYLSLLPQFIRPERGHVLQQGLVLGATQMAVSLTVNALIVLAAGALAMFLASRPAWQLVQRWLMGGVLGGLAVRMATQTRS